MASTSGGGHGGKLRNSAAKGRFLTLKITSRNGLNPTNVFVWKTEYFSRGFKQNSRQDMQLVATVSSLHICCHLNIEESKFCFSLRDDLRVHILCEQVLFMRAFSRFSAGNFKIFLPRWVLMLVRRKDMWPTWSSGCDFLRFLKSTEIIVWIISNWIMVQRSSERNHYNFFTFTSYPVFTLFILCATTTTVSAQQILAFARTSSVAISFSRRAARRLAATALRCFLNEKSSIFGLWPPKQRKDAHLKQVISTYGRICHGGQHKTWSIWERFTSMRNSWDCGSNDITV